MWRLEHLSNESPFGRLWRHSITALIVLGPLVLLLSLQPLVDPPSYHDFADRREFLGIPNFLDVVSSVPYLLLGAWGIATCRRKRPEASVDAWLLFFTGVALVGVGSSFYHWDPSSDTIFWDRLPMTLGFTALFVAILTDYVSPRLGGLLLVPMALVGLTSVIYGYWYEDFRLYAWVQASPMLAICAVILLYRPRYTHRGYLLMAFAGYVLAKLAELHDVQVFLFSGGIVSGHTVKHLLGVLAIWVLLRMVRRRKPVASA